MDEVSTRCQTRLRQREERGWCRRLRSFSTTARDFCSNDYLGLARDKTLQTVIGERLSLLDDVSFAKRNGGTGSRLISGNDSYVVRVEQKIAQFFGAEAALLLPSGYVANLCVFSALPQRHDVVYYDASIHASVKDGLRLGHAQFFSFKHQNRQDLEDKLRRRPGAKTTYVAVEAIYSMRGDMCDADAMLSLCRAYGAHLVVDEAHSTGHVNRGKGLFYGLPLSVCVHTFGKAWGVQGACILGSRWLKEYMINFARPFIYSTAMAPYQVAAIESSLAQASHHKKRRAALSNNLRHFKKELRRQKMEHLFLPSETPIQYFRVGDTETCLAIGERLQQENMLVLPILPPTVPREEEGLRISLHAFNSPNDISQLLSVLKEAWQETNAAREGKSNMRGVA